MLYSTRKNTVCRILRCMTGKIARKVLGMKKMKKRILSFILAMITVCMLLPVPAFAAVTSLDGVTFKVSANEDAGLDGDVKITFAKSGSDYSGTLYLPGSADAGKLTLSWEGGVTVSGCTSGETAIPENGASATYSVTAGESTANFTVKTVQGSVGVKGMFLTIDESMGTIAAMNNDPNHETVCYGSFDFKGKSYFLSMKGRGNWTWTNCIKKPYNLTVYKDGTYDKKDGVKLITDVKAKKWSILANELDPSYLRNKIGYDIACELGIGLPSESIDVWMNGEYLGNYLLTPKNDYEAPKNGYMVEIDNQFENEDQFTLSGSPLFTVKDMADGLTVNDVKRSVSAAWDALRKTDSDEYLKYFDLDSWAKSYLLQELYKNIDACVGSLFFTKAGIDDDSVLVAGPIWDLDQTLGRTNTSYVNLERNNENSGGGWYIDSISDSSFFQLLGKHRSFMQRVYEIYNENKADLENILTNVDTQSALIADSAEMDFAFWSRAFDGCAAVSQDGKTFGTGKYAVTYQKTDSWEAYVGNMKEYITKRLAFFSDNLTVTAPAGTVTGTTTVAVGDLCTLNANTTADGYQWQSSADGESWTDIGGATAKTYSAAALYTMNGLQIRCVAKNIGTTVNTTRVAKAAPAAFAALGPVTLTVTLDGHEHKYQTAVTAPTCTEMGYTTHTCSCGHSYKDTYTDAPGHNFVNGKCTRCTEKDPSYVPQCVGKKSVSLTAGNLIFTLGGHDLGEYTFAKSGNNWTIRDQNGKYLGFADNALSDNAFGWTYGDGSFRTSVTSANQSGIGGIIGRIFGIFGGNRTTTTTYYLVYTGGRISVSSDSGGSDATFSVNVENETHSFGDRTAKNGVHSRTCAVCGAVESGNCDYDDATHKCRVCGAYDPKYVSIDVIVSISQQIGGGNQGSGILGIISRIFSRLSGNRTTTTYTATINVLATGTTAEKVEYSVNNGASWTSGNTISSGSKIGSFLIRVTDGNGKMHFFTFDGTETIPQ